MREFIGIRILAERFKKVGTFISKHARVIEIVNEFVIPEFEIKMAESKKWLLSSFVFQHYQCNIVTVSLKTEVVIKIFEFEIKASSTTLQFLSVHKNSLQFQTVDVKVAWILRNPDWGIYKADRFKKGERFDPKLRDFPLRFQWLLVQWWILC